MLSALSLRDAIARALTTVVVSWPREHTEAINNWAAESQQCGRFAMRFPSEWRRVVDGVPSAASLVETPPDTEEEIGVVQVLKGCFGFLTAADGDRLYFSGRGCNPPEVFLRLSLGSRVAFRQHFNAQGPSATGVRPLDEPELHRLA